MARKVAPDIAKLGGVCVDNRLQLMDVELELLVGIRRVFEPLLEILVVSFEFKHVLFQGLDALDCAVRKVMINAGGRVDLHGGFFEFFAQG